MRLFKVNIDLEDTIEANSKDEAYTKFWKLQAINNENLVSAVETNTIITEVCPHCEIELESKMIDIDGTNLEEHTVCEKCGYGYPALR